MIQTSENIANMMNAPARQIKARVELYEGSPSVDAYNKTLLNTFTGRDALVEFSINRANEDGKFFGFGVCQELTVKLRDKDRLINVHKENIIEIAFGVDNDYIYPYPLFRVDTVKRDELNNDITITAYDFLYKAGKHRVDEIPLTSYTLREFILACGSILGLPVQFAEEFPALDLAYPAGANFEGSELLREALNAAAEALQAIYFVDRDWRLTFKRLDKTGNAVLPIDKSMYFELTNNDARRLATVFHATELGDNVSATDGEGVTQYVRNNPFWDLRDDIDTIVEDALEVVAGTTINQFECSWRGDFRIEIGDKISITTKDNNIIYTYVLNDEIIYNGGLRENTSWTFTEHDVETANNPVTLGDVFKQTYARVDKANKQIELVASEVSETNKQMSSLVLRTDGIEADVSSTNLVVASNLDTTNQTIAGLQKELNDKVTDLNDSVVSLSTEVSAQLTSEDVQLQITTALSNGIDSVSTTTGYTFNSEGLTVSKTGSEMSTQITEDGMNVKRGSETVLIADNEGVRAEDLNATTYLIVGGRSRFENYERDGRARTGCFWIG